MFDRAARRQTARIADRLARHLPARLTSLRITAIGLGLGFGSAIAAFRGWIAASVCLWLLNRFADGLDGAVARATLSPKDAFPTTSEQMSNQTASGRAVNDRSVRTAETSITKGALGGYLDLMADFLTYTIVPFGLAWHVDNRTTWIALGTLLGALYVNLGSWSVLSAILESRGLGAETSQESTTITMPPALIEGGETIVAYTAFLLFPAAAAILFFSFAVLVMYSATQRVRWATENLS
jgi:phosphatidylglycerophosphate synthase